MSAVVLMPWVHLLYTSTYDTPPPPAGRHCLTRSQFAAHLPSSHRDHVCCLPMLSCLSLWCVCGLGLRPFSVLVCDLLPSLRPWRLFHVSPKAHCRRVLRSQSWRAREARRRRAAAPLGSPLHLAQSQPGKPKIAPTKSQVGAIFFNKNKSVLLL